MTHRMFPSTPRRITRRRFLSHAAATGAALSLGPAVLRAGSSNEKLNIGIIGAGGRGRHNSRQVESENIAALCDVDEKHLAQAAEGYPKARKYVDFRKMLEARRGLDAVVVSTTNHTHAHATLLALDLGLPVYCEKPLTHTIAEARQVKAAAEKAGVATQMGTQNHSNDNFRRVVELIWRGAIGPVRECHVWVARAWGGGGRPKESQPVPDHLHWNLWLGPAERRPYHPIYHPRRPDPGWYKFWDFGGGTLPDLGSHWHDLPFWALKLDAPRTIEAEGPPFNPETAPAAMTVQYEFGPREEMPPTRLVWYQGQTRPSRYQGDIKVPDNFNSGMLFVGDEGAIVANYRRHQLLPEETFRDFQRPEPFISSSPGHHAEWIRACKTGSATGAHFGYAAPLTEMNHLGNIAYRLGKKLHWDPEQMQATNAPKAEELIHGHYRPGWALPT